MLNNTGMKTFVGELFRKSLPEHYYYHNIYHTLYVAHQAIEIGREENCSEEEIDLLYAAALWHDCGYLVTYLNHEEESCKMARQYLPGFDYTEDEIDKVCGMIMATKVPHSPSNKLEEIIADADMEYLGTEHAGPVAYSLFRELQHINPDLTEEEWDKKQIAFIKQHQYFTDYCKENKEPQKAIYLEELMNKNR